MIREGRLIPMDGGSKFEKCISMVVFSISNLYLGIIAILLVTGCSCNDNLLNNDGDEIETETSDGDLDADTEDDTEYDSDRDSKEDESDLDSSEEVDKDTIELDEDGEIEKELSDLEEDISEFDFDSLLQNGERLLSVNSLADGLDPIDINGDYAVWCYGAEGRLFAHKISTNTTKELVVDGVNHLCWWVSVDKGKAYSLASARTSNRTEIWEIDIDSGNAKILEVAKDAVSIDRIHARHGKLAWDHYPLTSPSLVGLYNHESKDYILIPNDNKSSGSPRLSSNYLVWTRVSGNTNTELWIYSFSDQSARILIPAEENDEIYRQSATVFGENVVWNWVKSDRSELRIYLTDIKSGESVLLQDKNIPEGPWIDGNLIVWRELDNDGTNRIRLYDIKSKEYMWITDSSWKGSQWSPKLSGRWLLYMDYYRFPDPAGFYIGGRVVLFDLCSLDYFKQTDICVK